MKMIECTWCAEKRECLKISGPASGHCCLPCAAGDLGVDNGVIHNLRREANELEKWADRRAALEMPGIVREDEKSS